MLSVIVATGAGLFGVANAKAAKHADSVETDEGIKKYPSEEVPAVNQPRLFSGATVYKGFVFVAGKGEHDEGDIKVHTEKVLDKIEEELVRAGSSMEKALQVNVYLHNLRDYDGMNDAYMGRFGNNPPARTTVSCYSGIPGNSLVEMDCIAAL